MSSLTDSFGNKMSHSSGTSSSNPSGKSATGSANRGSGPDGSRSLVQPSIPEGQTPTIVYAERRTDLHLSSRRGDVEGVKSILSKGETPVEAQDINDCTALHLAVNAGHDSVVKALLDGGASVRAVEESGDTPLHLAVYIESPDSRWIVCLLYTSPSPRDQRGSRMPSSA